MGTTEKGKGGFVNLDDKSLQRSSKKRAMPWPHQTQTPTFLTKTKNVAFWGAVTFSSFFTFLIAVGVLSEMLPMWVYFTAGLVTFSAATMVYQAVKVPLPHLDYLNVATSLWEATHIPHISEKLPSLLKDDAAQQLKHLRAAFSALEEDKRLGNVSLKTQKDVETVLVSVKEFLKHLETAYYISLNDERLFKNEPCVEPKHSHTIAHLMNDLSKKRLQLKHRNGTKLEVENLSYYATLSQSITDDAKSVTQTWAYSLQTTNPNGENFAHENFPSIESFINNIFVKKVFNR